MLNGKWQIVEAELGGNKLPADSFMNMVLELDENSYQLSEGKVIDSGLVGQIPDHDPPALSITGMFGPNQGKTFYCIYRFDGDDMIMCYNLGGDSIPTTFESHQHPLLYLVRYHRI